MPTQTVGARELISQKHVLWSIVIFASILAAVLQFFVEPLFIIVTIAMIPAVLYTFTKPYIGLLLYYFVMILHPAELAPALEAIRIERILAGFVALSFITVALVKYRSVKVITHRILLFVGLFFVVMSLSALTSMEASLTIFHDVDYAKKIVFVLLLAHIVDSHSRFRGFVWLHIVLMAYIAISAIIAYHSGHVIEAQGITRIKSLTSAAGDPNSLAASMAITIPFVFLIYKHEQSRFLKYVLRFFAVAMFYSIVLSGSRGGLLGTIAVVGMLWLLSRNKVVTGAAIVALGLLAVTLMPDQYIERYKTVTDYAEGGEVDASSQQRLDTWLAGLSMFSDRPILGVGAGAFGWAHAEYYSKKFKRSSLKAHNMYVQVLAELGLIGLLSFTLLLVAIFKENIRLRKLLIGDAPWRGWYRAVSLAITVSMVSLMITGIFAHSLYRFHWLLVGALTVAMYRIVRYDPLFNPPPADPLELEAESGRGERPVPPGQS